MGSAEGAEGPGIRAIGGIGRLPSSRNRSPSPTGTIELGPTDELFRNLLDADGDGDLDAVGWRIDTVVPTTNHRMRVWINGGDGTYSAGFGETFANITSTDVHSAVGRIGIDDGADDFVWTIENWFRVCRSGAGTFTRTNSITQGAPILGAAIGDFNGDVAMVTATTL